MNEAQLRKQFLELVEEVRVASPEQRYLAHQLVLTAAAGTEGGIDLEEIEAVLKVARTSTASTSRTVVQISDSDDETQVKIKEEKTSKVENKAVGKMSDNAKKKIAKNEDKKASEKSKRPSLSIAELRAAGRK